MNLVAGLEFPAREADAGSAMRLQKSEITRPCTNAINDITHMRMREYTHERRVAGSPLRFSLYRSADHKLA